jgi:hypothetical protein
LLQILHSPFDFAIVYYCSVCLKLFLKSCSNIVQYMVTGSFRKFLEEVF